MSKSWNEFDDELPTKPMKKGSLRKHIKRSIETDIHKMTTGQIVWHLTCRHKFTIALLWAVTMTVAFMATSLPPAIHNIAG